MTNQPIIIEKIFSAQVENIWKAITDKTEMKQWYFDLERFEPKVGFEFTFTGGPSPERQYVHLCKILESEENKKLKHSWRYEGYEGESFVTWELFPEANKTKLVLTHEALETFPASNPDFAKNNFVQGWNQIVNVSLKNYLEQ